MAFYACLFTMDQQSAFSKLVNHNFSFMHQIVLSERFLKCASWYNMGSVSFVDAGRKNSGGLNITSFAAQRRRFHKFSSIFYSLYMPVFFHSWKVKFSKVRFFFHWNWCFSREEHSVGYRARKRFCRKKEEIRRTCIMRCGGISLIYLATVRPKYFSWNEKSGKRTYACTVLETVVHLYFWIFSLPVLPALCKHLTF